MLEYLRHWKLTEWLGVCGFVIALLSVVLTWLQHNWARRAFMKEREEQVAVTAKWEIGSGFTVPTVVVRIVNTGRIAIHLDRVLLRWGGKIKKVGDSYSEMEFQQETEDSNPLAVGDDRTFFLPTSVPQPMLSAILNVGPRKVCLVVRSKQGEIARLEGSRIYDLVKSVAEARSAGWKERHDVTV